MIPAEPDLNLVVKAKIDGRERLSIFRTPVVGWRDVGDTWEAMVLSANGCFAQSTTDYLLELGATEKIAELVETSITRGLKICMH